MVLGPFSLVLFYTQPRLGSIHLAAEWGTGGVFTYIPKPIFNALLFLPILSIHHRHTAMCKFKVYSMILTYIHHEMTASSLVNIHHFVQVKKGNSFSCDENSGFTLLTTFICNSDHLHHVEHYISSLIINEKFVPFDSLHPIPHSYSPPPIKNLLQKCLKYNWPTTLLLPVTQHDSMFLYISKWLPPKVYLWSVIKGIT